MVGEPNAEYRDLKLPQTKINQLFVADDANLEGR